MKRVTTVEKRLLGSVVLHMETFKEISTTKDISRDNIQIILRRMRTSVCGIRDSGYILL